MCERTLMRKVQSHQLCIVYTLWIPSVIHSGKCLFQEVQFWSFLLFKFELELWACPDGQVEVNSWVTHCRVALCRVVVSVNETTSHVFCWYKGPLTHVIVFLSPLKFNRKDKQRIGLYICLYATITIIEFSLRVHLHQASASMLWQLCDDACDFVLIENSHLKMGCKPILERLH